MGRALRCADRDLFPGCPANCETNGGTTSSNPIQRGVCELSVPCGASNFRFGSPTARWRAADLGADLLVIGAYRHSRVRELHLGGFTRSILQSMILPELMSH